MTKKRDKSACFLIVACLSLISFAWPRGAWCAEGFQNVIIIGWDGTQRSHLKRMIAAGQLPNISRLKDEGSFVNMNVTTGRTATKPGWSEILTGYSSLRMGIPNNLTYRPIPRSYTIFERFKKYFGPANVITIFIGGKDNNIGSRGPHEICDNCEERLESHQKSFYWDKKLNRSDRTKDGQPAHWVKREGEPYYNALKSMDLHEDGLGRADNVGPEILKALDLYGKRRFLAFFHFEEPDEMGHEFKESSPQYDQGLENDDRWLGAVIDKLKKLDIYGKTLVIVTSDHGFDEGTYEHRHAPHTFLVVNIKDIVRLSGDRKDVTPTIYDALGIDTAQFQPPLDGKSLLNRK